MEKNSCRTCLREKRPNQLKLLSTKWNNSSLTFSDLLMNIVQINTEIKFDETLPKICSSCELDLITAHNFKNVCLNTEKILSDRLQQTILQIEVKEELIHEYKYVFNENDNDNVNSNENVCEEKLATEENLHTLMVKKEKTTKSTKSTDKKTLKKKIDQVKVIKEKKKPEKSIKSKKENKTNINRKDDLTFKKPKKPKNPRTTAYCKKCDIRFEKMKLYRQHCEEKHYVTYPCEICGKSFLQNRLQQHMVTHLTEKSCICDICDAKFVSLSKLKEHMRMHTGEKRYKCKFCDETFIYWTSRKNHHYKEHTREKKYECHLCHRMFAQSGQRDLHIKYHIGDLKYPCSICNKRFVHAYAVKRHERTHLKNRQTQVINNS